MRERGGLLKGVDALAGSWWGVTLSILALASIVYILPLAVDFPLLDPDEGLHASIAQEMVEHDSWITPTSLGKPFLDKPILYFWTLCLSLRIFGDHEAAIRLAGLMFGLLGAVTTGALGWRMFGRMTGLIAGAFYATTILPTALAQAAAHDVALIPCINLAMLFLWESDHVATRRSVLGCIAAAGFILGLAILAKGLIGIAAVGIAYGSYLLLSRRLSWSHCLRGAVVLLMAGLTASTWYIAVELQNPGYLRYFFFERHVLGFATTSQRHGGQPWWYYLPILLGGGLPWIGYLTIVVQDSYASWTAKKNAVASAVGGQECEDVCKASESCFKETRTVRRDAAPAMILLWCWLIGWTLLMSLAGSKLVTYLWPAFPAVALLAAVAWGRLIDGTLSEAARRSFVRTFVWSSWSGPIVLPVAAWAVQLIFAVRFPWHVWVIVGVAALATLLPLLPWHFGRPRAALASAVFCVAIQFIVVLALLVPPVANFFSARDLAEHFNRCGGLPTRLLLGEERIGSLVFYLDPQLRADLTPGRLQQILPGEEFAFLPGDVIAVPERRVSRADKYLHLTGLPYEVVGRHRLYRVETEPRGSQ